MRLGSYNDDKATTEWKEIKEKLVPESHTKRPKSRTINKWIDHTGHMVARREHGQLSVMY